MVDATGRKTIGKRGQDHDDSADEVWIRGFKEGVRRLRILDPTSDWWAYREHFGGKELGYYPCLEDPACIGDNALSERERNTSRKYAFNAMDENGRVNVYKLGGRLRKKFKMAEQRHGADVLARRDVDIIRSGSGFGDTEYDYDWGEEYELEDPPDEADKHNLGEVVTAKYYATEALAIDGGHDDGAEPEHSDDTAPDEAEPEATKQSEPEAEQPKRGLRKKAAAAPPKDEPSEPAAAKEQPRKRAAKKTAAAPPKDTADEAQASEAAAASNGKAEVDVSAFREHLRDMETDDIRSLLDNEEHKVEYPPRAPRPKLIDIAVAAAEAGVLPAF